MSGNQASVLAVLGPIRLHNRHPDILRLASLLGMAAGTVFAGEIVLEYILVPSNNRIYGLVEFCTVFVLTPLPGSGPFKPVAPLPCHAGAAERAPFRV